MKEEKNDIIYSAEYIRKYLNGQLSGPEMQALEKAALEDPFLADAIEGLEEFKNHPVSFESGIADLQKRLALRVGKRDRKKLTAILFSRWQIAASVILVLGTAVFSVVYLGNRSDCGDLAKTTQKDSISSKLNPMISATPADSAAMAKNKNSSGDYKSDSSVFAYNDDGPKVKLKNTTADLRKKQRPSVEKETELPTATSAEKLSDTSFEAKISTVVAKNADRRGAVPKPNISDSSRDPGTLDEVVVQGYGFQKKKDVTGSVTVSEELSKQPAEPVIGWVPFLRFVHTHKKISTADSLLNGEETISFIVHPGGRLSSFKIEKSVSPAHDSKLIRLIKTGSGWRVQDGKKQRCRVTVYF